MFGATHIGREHVRLGRNNQDGVFCAPGVVVVTDGCSSQPRSEIGAQLGAHFLGQWLLEQKESSDSLPARANEALLKWMEATARALGGPFEAVLEHYFLFTFLAAVRVQGDVLVFGVGDGGVLVDDRRWSLDSGPDNAPSYGAYGLVPELGRVVEVAVHHRGPAKRAAVMTDGLLRVSDDALLALTSLEGLDRNPLTLQRRLNVLTENERLHDDATVAILGATS